MDYILKYFTKSPDFIPLCFSWKYGLPKRE